MRLNFFFDIDETLMPVGKPIPESAIEALHKANAMGHRLFLCTGRSHYELPAAIRELPFDGGVFSAGARLLLDGRLIMQKSMSEEQKRFFRDTIEKYGLFCLNQCEDHTYATKEGLDFYNSLDLKVHGGKLSINGFKIVDEIPWDLPIVKSYILSDRGLVLEARSAMEGVLHSVNNTTGLPEECAAEIMVPGVTKASGIEELLRFIGAGVETTVGIGDGENDMEMVGYCHLGIAMGNACKALKDIADYVTTDIFDDGVANAIEYAMGKLG